MRNNEASTLSGCEGGVILKLRSFNSCDFPTNEGAKYHNNNWDAMEIATEHSLKCTPSLKLFFSSHKQGEKGATTKKCKHKHVYDFSSCTRTSIQKS